MKNYEYRDVPLEISLDTTAMLLERLRKGELDAACVITDPLPPTEWMIWMERPVPIVVAANPVFLLCGKHIVHLKELAAQKLLLMETEAPYSAQFEQAMAMEHLDCKPIFRLQSTQTALRVIERGDFITVLPLYAVKSAAEAGQVRILHVSEWQNEQIIQTVLCRSKALTPQITGFLEELNQFLDQLLKQRME